MAKEQFVSIFLKCAGRFCIAKRRFPFFSLSIRAKIPVKTNKKKKRMQKLLTVQEGGYMAKIINDRAPPPLLSVCFILNRFVPRSIARAQIAATSNIARTSASERAKNILFFFYFTPILQCPLKSIGL